MNILGYILLNAEKVERALRGAPSSDGQIKGGVARDVECVEDVWMKEGVEMTESEVETLAVVLIPEYDRLGGLIKKGNDKIKTGSFYDFAGRKPHKEPKIVFTYLVNGKFVDVPEGKELPGEVKAVKILEEQAGEPKAKKSRKIKE